MALTLTRRASSLFPCDQALLYEILTDYDTYSDWLPLVVASKLLAREGDLAIVEFDLGTRRGEKVALECIHTKNKMVLGRPISGRTLLSKIEWNLEPAAEGTQVRLTIQARPNWRWLVPRFRKILHAASCLEALRSQLSAYQPELVVSGPEGEKVLELIETPDGFQLWLRGKKYNLTPAQEK
jgi:hypothetical protein